MSDQFSEPGHTESLLVRGLHKTRTRVLVSGGGTGGHIYPALAVAKELVRMADADILYLGDTKGMEREVVTKAGIRLASVNAGRLLRFWSLQTMIDLSKVPIGILQALAPVWEFKPHAAFTSGGHVSVPAGLAAWSRGVPLIIHQQDVLPNLANRILSPLATSISVTFSASLEKFSSSKVWLAGNPVRDAFYVQRGKDSRAMRTSLGFRADLPLLFVFGGSQGAAHINEVVAASLPVIMNRFQVLHCTGRGDYGRTSQLAASAMQHVPIELRYRYRAEPYLDEALPVALAAADLIISRAGASGLAELATLGKPSLLIPLPSGIGASPQEANARLFEREGASRTILDKNLTPELLIALINDLHANGDLLVRMGEAAKRLARDNAATTIAARVLGLAGHGDVLGTPSTE